MGVFCVGTGGGGGTKLGMMSAKESGLPEAAGVAWPLLPVAAAAADRADCRSSVEFGILSTVWGAPPEFTRPASGIGGKVSRVMDGIVVGQDGIPLSGLYGTTVGGSIVENALGASRLRAPSMAGGAGFCAGSMEASGPGLKAVPPCGEVAAPDWKSVPGAGDGGAGIPGISGIVRVKEGGTSSVPGNAEMLGVSGAPDIPDAPGRAGVFAASGAGEAGLGEVEAGGSASVPGRAGVSDMPGAGMKAGGTFSGAAGIFAVPGGAVVFVSTRTGGSGAKAGGAGSTAGAGWDAGVSAGSNAWEAGEAWAACDGALGGLG